MRLIMVLLGALTLALPVSRAGAQEVVRYGTATKLSPTFYLPVLAAQEQGIFKKNGVGVDYFPSQSGADMQRALAASAIKIGASSAGGDILSIARGVPVIIVANLHTYDDFGIWVASNSRIRKPQDLKGAKLGVSRFGGLEQAYGLLVAKQLGLGNDVQFVSTGGVSESLAVLTTGAIDGVVLAPVNMMNLMLEGRVRSLLLVRDYLPKSWAAYTLVARRDFVEDDTATAKKVVQSIVEANRYLGSPEAKPWVIAKMRELNNYTAEGAELIYKGLSFSTDGRMQPDALRNVTDFMVEHGLLKSGEVPPPDRIYTDRLVK